MPVVAKRRNGLLRLQRLAAAGADPAFAQTLLGAGGRGGRKDLLFVAQGGDGLAAREDLAAALADLALLRAVLGAGWRAPGDDFRLVAQGGDGGLCA